MLREYTDEELSTADAEGVPLLYPGRIHPESWTQLSEALSILMLKAPYWACYAYERNTSFVEAAPDAGVNTACTDGKRIYINRKWFDALPNAATRAGLLAHEIGHDEAKHTRLMRWWSNTGGVMCPDGTPRPYDRKLMNIAMDGELNAALRAAGFKLPAEGVNIPWVEPFAMSCIEIYQRVYDEAQKDPQAPRRYGAQPDDVRPAPDPENPSDDAGDPTMGTSLEDVAHTRARQTALQQAMARGTVPAGLRSRIDGLTEPVVDWKEQLKDLVIARVGGEAYDFTRMNRKRFVLYGVVDPARRSFATPPVAIIVDSSGSIVAKAKEFLSEAADILVRMRPKRVDVLWVDAEVHRVDTLDAAMGDDETAVASLEVVGHGGTDMTKGFDEIARRADEQGEDVAAVIVLTDSYTPWPSDWTRCPVFVGTTSPGQPHPEGWTVVEIPE